MSHTRVEIEALAWSLVQQAMTSRKPGSWRRRLASLVRWRCSQLDFSGASKRLLQREIAGVLEHIRNVPPPTLGST